MTTFTAPTTATPASDDRTKILQRRGAMDSERSGFITHWQELARRFLPRSGRFMATDKNRAGKHNWNNIIDNTGTRALRTLGGLMMSAGSSPARPWHRLETDDPELNDFLPVKLWLEEAARRQRAVWQHSNTYRVLHKLYEEDALFGTACAFVLPSFETMIHLYPVPVGEFLLAQSYEDKVNTVYREFELTVAQVVEEFGINNVSIATRNQFRNGNLQAQVRILHAVEPRKDRSPQMRDNLNMPFRSVYLEIGKQRELGFLRRGGFERFPALTPRWDRNSGEVYGTSCPGMESLGDVLQLQHEQMRKAEAIDYQTKPPVQAPADMANQDRETLPGGIMWYEPGGIAYTSQTGPNTGIRTAFEVQLDLNAMREDIIDVRGRIRASWFADLVLMLHDAGPNTRMTATEIAERHEEKLMMLGPVLESVHTEMLGPLVDLTLARMFDVGALPPPPPELIGRELSVKFVSILAQAQRAIGATSTDRFLLTLGQVAQFKGDVIDKFNADRWFEIHADQLGLDPRIIVGDEQVRQLRDARAQAQAAAEQTELMAQQAKTARDLSQANTTGDNVLSDLTGFSTPESPAPL